jgi:prepilin-type N-terminal cleavage/methylation domain-containing protein
MFRVYRRAFTLIELLIVVAIIAILAAIAVPNFLEAQTRSKVTRAKADLRTMTVGLEAYATDYSKPPREYNTGTPYRDPLIVGEPVTGIVGPWLSTPVAYLQTALMLDPFVQRGDRIPWDEKYFTYHNNVARRAFTGTANQPNWGDVPRAEAIIAFYGAYRLCSIGPDRDFYNNLSNPGTYHNFPGESITYDASNGTVSEGNIWRRQGGEFDGQPPIGPALAAH